MLTDLNDLEGSAERLNKAKDELLTLDLQDASAADHLGAAEGLLSLYEQSTLLQTGAGLNVEAEGAMELIRHAAEMHIAIAAVKAQGV